MGKALAAAGVLVGLAGSGGAWAQGYGQAGGDPCRPATSSYSSGSGLGYGSSYGSGLGAASGAIGMLAHMFSEPSRARDCTELRRAQWAEYNAKQKAAKDKADADAAAAKQAADSAAAAKVAEAAQVARVHEAVVARRAAGAAAARRERSAAREAEARAQRVADAEAARKTRAADAAHRAAYVAMVAAENSAENMCRQPKVARVVMDGWNGLDAFHNADVRVIDIEHFTTVAWHPGAATFACHGVFVTNKGWRVVGTAVMKRNVAGDPMFVWQRDGRQDLADYEAPAMDAGSPEVGSGVSVGAAVPQVREVVAKGADGRM